MNIKRDDGHHPPKAQAPGNADEKQQKSNHHVSLYKVPKQQSRDIGKDKPASLCVVHIPLRT